MVKGCLFWGIRHIRTVSIHVFPGNPFWALKLWVIQAGKVLIVEPAYFSKDNGPTGI